MPKTAVDVQPDPRAKWQRAEVTKIELRIHLGLTTQVTDVRSGEEPKTIYVVL
jgi:hypothetical protein